MNWKPLAQTALKVAPYVIGAFIGTAGTAAYTTTDKPPATTAVTVTQKPCICQCKLEPTTIRCGPISK